MKTKAMKTFSCCAAVALMLAVASSASAQYEHLKGFKIKDSKTFKKATANILVTSGHFAGLENCQILPGAKEWCVPVDKSNVVVEDGTETPLAGEEQTADRL